MSEPLYIASLGMFFGTIAAVFGMKYFAQGKQTANSAEREEAYRVLAEKATSVIAAVQAELAEMKMRLASVETLLKTVE